MNQNKMKFTCYTLNHTNCDISLFIFTWLFVLLFILLYSLTALKIGFNIVDDCSAPLGCALTSNQIDYVATSVRYKKSEMKLRNLLLSESFIVDSFTATPTVSLFCVTVYYDYDYHHHFYFILLYFC